jgi:hypothetical protein
MIPRKLPVQCPSVPWTFETPAFQPFLSLGVTRVAGRKERHEKIREQQTIQESTLENRVLHLVVSRSLRY